jgi:hypothetical protein
MKLPFAFLIAAAMWAKAPTVRIMIAGGGLTHSIEVTDPQLLNISHAWSSEFLDTSRAPLPEVPQVNLKYEISFYSQIDLNDVRKTCVIYYSPNSFGQGFIYLPGKGTGWYLNAGTIIRQGRDGKWSYASPAWEALIKAAVARGSALSGSAPSEVVIDEWTKPHVGWLYVLDPRSESDHPGSRVWLVDPETAKVMGSVHAGYDPDFAFSPDGRWLYILSGERDSAELLVVDTADGKARRVAFPDRVLYHPWYQGLPPYSRMAVSSDGISLWILDVFIPDQIGNQLRVFDTRSGRFLPDAVATSNIQFVGWDAAIIARLPRSASCGVADGFVLPGGKTLAIVRTDGAIYEMDTFTREFHPTAITGNCSRSESGLVYRFPWPRSPDGGTLYLGYGPPEPDGMATSHEFRVIDTTAWKEMGRIRTSSSFWSAVASRDGTVIYAPAPRDHSVLVIDAAARQEKHALRVGQTPALALVAP